MLLNLSGIGYESNYFELKGFMEERDTVIIQRVTKPKLYDEAIRFRAKKGTKSRIDKLRGDKRHIHSI